MAGDAAKEIKERLSVSEVLGEYLRIMQRGALKKALCPFHNEKTPSFVISDDKRMWHCFGCGKGGDIFSFLMEYEGIEFPEALQILAKKAGIELSQFQKTEDTKKTLLLRILSYAADYWHSILLSDAGRVAREYCKERGITPEDIEYFHIGFALDDWEVLTTSLRKKKVTDDLLFSSGIAVRNERNASVYDRFRGRLMFPITDVHGQVVGFSGRILNPTEKEAKYINTPQTEVYDKSAVLFGLHLAKDQIRKQDLALIVEGQMDVVASHRAGVTNVVAVSGTALTEKQVELLGRYTKKVALCFDADAAGLKATVRSLTLLWDHGFDIYAIVLPSGSDPDECVRKDPHIWVHAVQQRAPILDFYLDVLSRQYTLSVAEGKRDMVREFIPLLARIKDMIVQSHYIQKLSVMVGVSEDVLRTILATFVRSQVSTTQETSHSQNKNTIVSERKNTAQSNTPRYHEHILRFMMIMMLEQELAHLVRSKIDFAKLEPFTPYQELLMVLNRVEGREEYFVARGLQSGFSVIETELKDMSRIEIIKEFMVLLNHLFISTDPEYKYELPQLKHQILSEIQRVITEISQLKK